MDTNSRRRFSLGSFPPELASVLSSQVPSNKLENDLGGLDDSSIQDSQMSSNSLSSNISTVIKKYKLLENIDIDLDDESLGDTDSAKKRFQNWKGNNIFLCGGWLMFGPSYDQLLLTIALIIVIWALNFLLVAPFFQSRLYVYISVFLFSTNLITLLVTATVDPGIIPRRNNKRIVVDNNIEVFLDMNCAEYNYCKTCRIIKPTRVKHCRVCDNCIQGFDHHCPWIGTCIGIRNYIFFGAFLLFLVISIIFCIASVAVLGIGMYYSISCNRPNLRVISVSLMLPPLLVFFIFIGSLFLFHVYLSYKGITTNEFIRGTKESNDTNEIFSCTSTINSYVESTMRWVFNIFRSSFQLASTTSTSTSTFDSKSRKLNKIKISISKTQSSQIKEFLSGRPESYMKCCDCMISDTHFVKSDLNNEANSHLVELDTIRERVLQGKNSNCCEISTCATLFLGRNWMTGFLTRKPSLLLPMYGIENEYDLLQDIDLSIYLLSTLKLKMNSEQS